MVATVKSRIRERFFYGWVIVAVGFIIELMIVSLRFYGLSVFVKPMSQDLRWSRALFSGVVSFGNVVNGLVSPFVGPTIDKRGGRELMLVGAVICGAGFVGLGFVQGVWDFYFLRGIVVIVGIVCAGPLVVNVAISNWFIRKRGRAVSFGLMGVSLGGAVVAPLATYLIGAYGWRMAWVILGSVIWIVVIPVVALFIKRRPEDIGLLPDGDSPVGVRRVPSGRGSGASPSLLTPDPRPPAPAEAVWTRREAIRTPALWLTIVAFGVGGIGSGAIGLHFFPYLTDIGLTDAAAATVYSVYAVWMACSKPAWGLLIDRYTVRRCGVVAFAVLAASVALVGLLSLWPSLWLVYLAALCTGFGMAGQQPVQEVLWANYFGRLSLGAIRTIASPFSIIFGAGGPLFAGWIYDTFNSYWPAWVVFSVTYVAGAVLVHVAHVPVKVAGAKG